MPASFLKIISVQASLNKKFFVFKKIRHRFAHMRTSANTRKWLQQTCFASGSQIWSSVGNLQGSTSRENKKSDVGDESLGKLWVQGPVEAVF